MAQTAISLRARMPEENIREIFAKHLSRQILRVFYPFIELLFRKDDLANGEIAAIFSVFSYKYHSVAAPSNEFRQAISRSVKPQDIDCLLREVNRHILNDSNKIMLAMKFMDKTKHLSILKRKKLALYFCLVLSHIK